MDPFSLAVGIAGLAGLAATAVELARDYMNSVKTGKSSILTLVTELEALQSNLSSLDGFLRSLSINDVAFQHTSVLRSCASSCETKLKALCQKLGQKTVQELRAFAQWIQFALSVDGCSLLSKSSADILQVLEQHVANFRLLQTIEHEITVLQDAVQKQTRMIQDHKDAKARQQVLNWISSLDQDQKHNTVRSPRVEGTGAWLLQEPQYVQWRDCLSDSNVLWCHGDPGSGKSVLTSMVIDELRNSPEFQHPIAFLYFDYQDKDHQTLDSMLSSLLRQLVAAMPEIPKCIQEFYEKSYESGLSLSGYRLERLLLDVLSILQKAYIIIDALDECDEFRHRKHFLLFIDRLKKTKSVLLYVASRSHIQDINASFQGSPHIEVQAHDFDLRRYVEQELFQIDVMNIINDTFATEIIETVLGNAHGMFLLPVLQLRTILKEPTAGDMEDALASLSGNLPEAFEQTVIRIQSLPESRRRVGMDALMWICHSRRPMTISELSDALAVRPGHTEVRPRHRPSTTVIIECCQGLLSVHSEGSIVRLAHKSVQEYLIIHGDKLFQNADATIAATCFTYLLFDIFKLGPVHDHSEIEDRIKSYPLLAYATEYGAVHAYEVQQDENTQRHILAFLASREAVACANQVNQFHRQLRKEYWDPEECNSITALHVASRFGFEIIVRKLLSTHAFPVDVATKMGTTPLIMAAAGGHVSVTRLLLTHGANAYVENWYGNALHCAAEAGHPGTIRELVSRGMSPNIRNEWGRMPLQCTIDLDHGPAFETLIEVGAEMEFGGVSAFNSAVGRASINIIKLILRKKWVDVNGKTESGFTALHFAARNSNVEVVQALIDAGAEINVEDGRGRKALDIALDYRNDAIIRLLGSGEVGATAV